MERVVYVLGAGFSASLGLPTMRDFLDKSKDMASAEPERWGYFETLFKRVREVDGAGKYFAGDYFNVEEMLSLLEMRADLGDSDLRKDLERYIRAVIQHYTPEPEPYDGPWPSNWPDVIFGKGRLAGEYGSFVCCLLGITLTGPAPHDMAAVLQNSAHATEYGVVSLNYDRVLENSASFLASRLGAKGPLRFRRPGDKQEPAPRPVLAKLHGDVEKGPIVAPTWTGVVQFVGTPRARERRLGLERSCIERANGL